VPKRWFLGCRVEEGRRAPNLTCSGNAFHAAAVNLRTGPAAYPPGGTGSTISTVLGMFRNPT